MNLLLIHSKHKRKAYKTKEYDALFFEKDPLEGNICAFCSKTCRSGRGLKKHHAEVHNLKDIEGVSQYSLPNHHITTIKIKHPYTCSSC